MVVEENGAGSLKVESIVRDVCSVSESDNFLQNPINEKPAVQTSSGSCKGATYNQ